jgi:hypothetical protein
MTDYIAPTEDALYERIRLRLFSVDLPVQRLEADIDDIGRFTAPEVRSPRLRLIEVMPPLTPAAEAIVRAIIMHTIAISLGAAVRNRAASLDKSWAYQVWTDRFDAWTRRAGAGACPSARRGVQPRFRALPRKRLFAGPICSCGDWPAGSPQQASEGSSICRDQTRKVS